MGTCLIANNRQDKQSSTQSSPINLRDQIKQQIVKRSNSDIPHLNIEKQESPEDSLSIESIKLNLNERNLYTSSRIIQSTSSLNDINVKGSTKRSLKPVIITSQAISSIKNASESLRQQISKELTLSQIDTERDGEEIFQYQTPFNRLYEPLSDMIGQGLRDQDNLLIQSTKTAKQSIKLNAIKFKNGSIYLGQWMLAKRHGKGVLFWRDGSRYQGQWIENCSQGYGKLIYNQNQHYQGNFTKNYRHGHGKFISFNVVYEGQWEYDKLQGEGRQSWGNGSFYKGKWVNGYKHGEGYLCFQDGSYYKGAFNSNQIHGYGEYCWADSRTYVGFWEHNRMMGNGILIWKNGQRYEGGFKNDKMHGYGKFTQSDGSVYQGNFQLGRRHGKATQSDLQGNIKKVEYYMGRKICHDKSSKGQLKRRKNVLQNLHGSTY